jgi:hypothetical protein
VEDVLAVTFDTFLALLTVRDVCTLCTVCRRWRDRFSDPRCYARIAVAADTPRERGAFTDGVLGALLARARGGVTHVSLTNCDALSDAGLQPLRSQEGLACFELGGAHGFTAHGVSLALAGCDDAAGVVALMRARPGDARTQQRCCFALGVLTRLVERTLLSGAADEDAPPVYRYEFPAPGVDAALTDAIPAVCACLSAHAAHAGVQRAGWAALWPLLQSDDDAFRAQWRDDAAAAGALEAGARALAQHGGCDAIVEGACLALASCAHESAQHAARVAALGAAPLLAALAGRGSEVATARAFHLLLALGCTPGGPSAAALAGVAIALQRLLDPWLAVEDAAWCAVCHEVNEDERLRPARGDPQTIRFSAPGMLPLMLFVLSQMGADAPAVSLAMQLLCMRPQLLHAARGAQGSSEHGHTLPGAILDVMRAHAADAPLRNEALDALCALVCTDGGGGAATPATAAALEELVRRGALRMTWQLLLEEVRAAHEHDPYAPAQALRALCAASEGARDDAVAACAAELEREAGSAEENEVDGGMCVRWLSILTDLVRTDAAGRRALQAGAAEAALVLLQRSTCCAEPRRRMLVCASCSLLKALALSSPAAAACMRRAGVEGALLAAQLQAVGLAAAHAVVRARLALRVEPVPPEPVNL